MQQQGKTPAASDVRIVPLAAARDEILALAATSGRSVVGVTGPVGSGKSTLARMLSDCIIATDDYLPDYDKVQMHERDLPEFADLPRLVSDLAALRAGRPAEIPIWSFHSHSREGYRTVHPPEGGLVICEGIHALHHRVRHAFDVRVFIEAPSSTRLARWIAIAESGQRGWGPEETRQFFHNVAEPTFARLAPDYRGAAHIIVVNE